MISIFVASYRLIPFSNLNNADVVKMNYTAGLVGLSRCVIWFPYLSSVNT